MSKTEGQAGLLRVMGGFVLLTGGLVALSLLATNPREESAASIGAIARAPASLVGMAMAANSSPIVQMERTLTLEFDCAPPTNTVVTPEVKQLRLSGRLCEKAEIREIEVLNLTNGFTATIFTPTPTKFSSDYIHLAEGENRLRVVQVLASGERKILEFQIARQPAATQSN